MNYHVKNMILTPMNILYRFNPRLTFKLLYRLKTGYPLNLDQPITYTEKLQWMKLNFKNDLMPVCADKYEVRQYVKDCGCEKILNTLLWEGLHPDDIPFDELPERFVIKVTHGQGFNIICKDKSALNIQKTIRVLKRWLRTKFLPCYGEWFYGVKKPRIIIEQFLDDETYDSPVDYKVFCFHGNPKMIHIHVNRFSNHKRNFYDIDWNVMDHISMKYVDPNLIFEKPKELDQLLEYARRLSADFIHVRVDFYIIQSKIYFGELTFTENAGFDKIRPREFDKKLGDWMIL
jgi:hypothetical protein